MFERFTDRARMVMQLANQEAMRLNHEYIGTEHVLLGLVQEGSGTAATVFKNLDIDLLKVRTEIEKIIPCGPDPVSQARLPMTPRAKKVVEYAREEAFNLKHSEVGTEHLLLGLLREQEGVGAQVLMNLGLRLEIVRREVLIILGVDLTGLASAKFYHLPDHARRIALEFDWQIERLEQEQKEASAAQDWDNAADMRTLRDKLKELRADFVRHWPKDS
jgi:ATP-dependent Clp protease ATP-binding subunit ClpC